jgi:hypothetical protein
MELLNDVEEGLFTELKSKKPIDNYRRKLQKSYVDKLNNILNPASSSGGLFISFGRSGSLSPSELSRSDIPAIVRAQLSALKTQVSASVASTNEKMSRIHLIDLLERIKDSLSPKS